ncbi:hypothetical protein PR202_gb16445 [Eleusine coracana subsp. coracana]|uniref:F-box/LRR-repeat protein 15/At3g58940/PEG3-like LRR domain-containing protein n=1 Tax=Eleusine coracana subsp. coracana TaxID=191504 RepID=A0AAV5F1Z6_ELECO|nr:hypothetical protein PR202_gb16445 [Eleusine coracana subsp. coracana]
MARAPQQKPYTADGGQIATGRKRSGEELPRESKRPLPIGDGFVPSSRFSHTSDPLEPLIKRSIAAFATNDPRDLDIIRTALLALPKAPNSVLHPDRKTVGSDASILACTGTEGDIRDSGGASTKSVEVLAYDIIGPDLARYGYILSNPWRVLWEQNDLVLHDTDIMHVAKAVIGQLNLSQRITTILQNHPGQVRYFRIDSCWLENGTEELEEWFEMLKLKNVREVVFVNCRWPFDVIDFPLNSLDCESLERLRLCFVKIADICLNHVDNLMTIDLACCSISTQDLLCIAGLKRPPPSVEVWIPEAPFLTNAQFDISLQSVTINNVSAVKGKAPMASLKRLILHRNDKVYNNEPVDAVLDEWPAKLKHLPCLQHLQEFSMKDYRGGDIELAIASAILEYAPTLQQLVLYAGMDNGAKLARAETKLKMVSQASVDAVVRYLVSLGDRDDFFSDGG